MVSTYCACVRLTSGLSHHGIKGQKWGVRRFQTEDGKLTPDGRIRYGKNVLDKNERKSIQNNTKDYLPNFTGKYSEAKAEMNFKKKYGDRWDLGIYDTTSRFRDSSATSFHISPTPDKTNSIYIHSGQDWAVARIQRLSDTKYSVAAIGAEGLISQNRAKRYVKRILKMTANL